MNIRRGFFRIWLVTSIVWTGVIVWLANADLEKQMLKKAYIYQEVIDKNCKTKYDRENYPTFKELYPACTTFEEGTFIKPSTYSQPPVFIPHERAGAGWTSYDFPDGSRLMLDQSTTPNQTGKEAEFLKDAFWGQRWERYWPILDTWRPWVIWPPFLLGVLFIAIDWMIKGFRYA
jgi:hypothetical protein